MTRTALAILLAGTAHAAIAQESTDQATIDLGRQYAEAFFADDLGPVWDRMTPDMRDALTSLDGFGDTRDAILGELGDEVSVTDETVTPADGLSVYRRIGDWSQSDVPVRMQIGLDANGDIAAFLVQPEPVAAQSDFLDHETEADLRLPFTGDWTVFWGGRTIAQNYHAANPAQRFAIDAIVVGNDGLSYTGEGALPEDHFCWGREILAPADGLVIGTVNDLPDQAIGASDPDNPAGNHVILSVGEEEFAFLAHLQQGSVRVQQGDEVESGDVLGLCGNSGNTSEPHLHVHLQNTPDLADGEGLPAQFQDYLANGELVERGEPEQGQVIAPASL